MKNRKQIRHSTLSLLALCLSGSAVVAQSPENAPAPPIDPVKAIDMAIHAIETGDLRQADQLIRDVSATHPKMSRLNLANGMLLIELSRFAEAIEAFGLYNATDEGNRDYRGWAAVGSVYLKSYMYSSAIGPLEKALDLVPIGQEKGLVKARIALDLARTHLGLNDRKSAIKAIKDARGSASDVGEIQAVVCELASRAGDSETAVSAGASAIKAFGSDLGVNPLSVPAHRGLVRCYQVLYSEQTIKLSKNPTDGQSFVEAARLLRSIAEIERRIRLLDAHGLMLQALESKRDSVDWQLIAAELEIDLGATSEAAARIDAVLASDPENAAALVLKHRLTPSAG